MTVNLRSRPDPPGGSSSLLAQSFGGGHHELEPFFASSDERASHDAEWNASFLLKDGRGPPLVLVHGSFGDDVTNRELVEPIPRESFSLYAIARRDPGAVGRPEARALRSSLPWHPLTSDLRTVRGARSRKRLERSVAFTFFRDSPRVPVTELEGLGESALWPPIVADAKATLEDRRALARYDFVPERFANLAVPVLQQIGSASPRPLHVTDALAAVLPDSRIQVLPGQAHERMTTPPRYTPRR